MPTYVHECEKRGRHVVCPACGRVAPDYCPLDEPEKAEEVDHVLTGADLPESLEAVQEALEVQQELNTEAVKVRRGRKAKGDA